MKRYTKPEIELARFECEDIMSLSGTSYTPTMEQSDSTGVDIVTIAKSTTADTAAKSPFDPLN